jgi:hypothetical protein
MGSLKIALVLAAIVTGASAQGQDHRALIVHAQARVFGWAHEALQQMGYAIQKLDSAAGVLVAERASALTPTLGNTYDRLEVHITAGNGDTTVVQIGTSSWKQFPREVSRHRITRPTNQAELDAQRVLEILR